MANAIRPFLALCGLCVSLVGCATPPPKKDKLAYQAYQQQNDPLKPMNQAFYKVNNVLDTYIMLPVAEGYDRVTSQPFRNHVTDFMNNLSAPGQLLCFMAAGKPTDAGTTLVRFLVNSTIGMGGIFDPASALGYHRVYTDLGLTLAGYGVPPGPYLYLPLFGPSGLRDATSIPADVVLSPTFPAPGSTALTAFNISSNALNLVNLRAELIGPIKNIKETALDPYATFRSLYRQHRASELHTINVSNVPSVPAWYPPAERRAMQKALDAKYRRGF